MTELLQSRLDAYKAQSRARQAPEVSALLESSIKRLRANHPASRYLKPGERFPDFNLPDSAGQTVRLRDLLAQGPVVISFYRGLWCPYCNLELDALGEAYSRIRELGAELLAISPQTAANSNRAIRTNKLPFRILVDPGNKVADAAGLRYRLEPALVDAYSRLGVNLPLINGDDSWTLPIPARIVVGIDGRVQAISADPDYTKRPDPSETVRFLEGVASLNHGG